MVVRTARKMDWTQMPLRWGGKTPWGRESIKRRMRGITSSLRRTLSLGSLKGEQLTDAGYYKTLVPTAVNKRKASGKQK